MQLWPSDGSTGLEGSRRAVSQGWRLVLDVGWGVLVVLHMASHPLGLGFFTALWSQGSKTAREEATGFFRRRLQNFRIITMSHSVGQGKSQSQPRFEPEENSFHLLVGEIATLHCKGYVDTGNLIH